MENVRIENQIEEAEEASATDSQLMVNLMLPRCWRLKRCRLRLVQDEMAKWFHVRFKWRSKNPLVMGYPRDT